MKGKWGVEAILFLASVVLCVVAAIGYIKRDDGVGQKLDAFSTNQIKFAQDTVEMLASLNKRLDVVEKKNDQTMSVNLKEPVQINLVYKEDNHTKSSPIPQPPVKIEHLHPRENN